MTRVISSILGNIPGMGSKADTMKLGGIEQHLSKGNSINSADMDFLLEHRLKSKKTQLIRHKRLAQTRTIRNAKNKRRVANTFE